MPSRSTTHECHAIRCRTTVPPRMHMCRSHWRIVPRSLQNALWDAYVPGQERTKTPSPEYLRAAAACVRAVAEAEQIPESEIDADVRVYLRLAEVLETEDG